MTRPTVGVETPERLGLVLLSPCSQQRLPRAVGVGLGGVSAIISKRGASRCARVSGRQPWLRCDLDQRH